MKAEGDVEVKSLLIGGSGAYLIEKKILGEVVDSKKVQTPFGESSPFTLVDRDGFLFYFLSRHGEKGYEISAPFVNYRANIFAAKLLGVEKIVSWSGPGIISEGITPGSFVIPDDVLDFTKNRPCTFFEGKGLGFIRQNPVFCPHLFEALVKAAERSGVRTVKGGVYACTEGPRLETPAEIRMLKALGADLVGMTVVPECFLARELEICYHPICYTTNFAEGVKELPYEKGVLFEGTLPKELANDVERAREALPIVCVEALMAAEGLPRDCPCAFSMERYRKKGLIGDDFREWVASGDDEAF